MTGVPFSCASSDSPSLLLLPGAGAGIAEAAPELRHKAVVTLPPAVAIHQTISPAAQREVQRLMGRKPVAFCAQVLLTWAVIAGVIALAGYVQHFWVSVLAIVIVASRQNVLGLLVHEQVHCLAFPSRGGDLVANLVAGYPLLALTVEGYAPVHLAHHRGYFTDDDPDFVRKSGSDWSFPMQPAKLLGLVLSDLVIGMNLWRLLRGKTRRGNSVVSPRPGRTPRWVRPAYFLAWALFFTLTGTWHLFLLYWLLPLLTVFQLLVRWGAICEHIYNVPHGQVEETTPLILPRWWERLLLPNLNFTLHVYHHRHPGVPYGHLPRVHELYRREGLVNEANVFHGYGSYVKWLMRSPARSESLVGVGCGGRNKDHL